MLYYIKADQFFYPYEIKKKRAILKLKMVNLEIG